jgi:biuret amidohydrolase
MRIYVYGEAQDTRDRFEDYLDPGKTAIVSIDMHRGHLDDSPDCPCPAPRARDIVAPIDTFHDAARKLGVPIIHVRSVVRRGGEDDTRGIPSAWRRTFPLHVGEIPSSDGHAIEGSRWTEFVTKVEPNDLIVETKRRLSAFYPTDLDFLLRNMRIESIVLDGGFTDCCILNAAFDASNHNYGRARSGARHRRQSGKGGAGDGVAASRPGGRFRRHPQRMARPPRGPQRGLTAFSNGHYRPRIIDSQ